MLGAPGPGDSVLGAQSLEGWKGFCVSLCLCPFPGDSVLRPQSLEAAWNSVSRSLCPSPAISSGTGSANFRHWQ